MGCAKNGVDSENLMGRLAFEGHTVVADPEDAHVGIINTAAWLGVHSPSGRVKYFHQTSCLVFER